MIELNKPVRRKIHCPGHGDYVVALTPAGVSIRKLRKRKAVVLPYEQLALRALECDRWLLNAKEWDNPLGTLNRLARLKQGRR